MKRPGLEAQENVVTKTRRFRIHAFGLNQTKMAVIQWKAHDEKRSSCRPKNREKAL